MLHTIREKIVRPCKWKERRQPKGTCNYRPAGQRVKEAQRDAGEAGTGINLTDP
jgi:hypothetical protein